MSIIQDFIASATKEVGTKESPLGSNWGPRVAEYIRSAGYDEPVFWCMCFVVWCLRETMKAKGISNPFPRTGSCDIVLFWARKNGYLHDSPRVGDVFLVLASPNDATHTGIVTAVNDNGTINAIEGNGSQGGSRNGIAVVARQRKSAGLKFVRWVDALPGGSAISDAAALPEWSLCLQAGDDPAVRIGVISLQAGTAFYPARALLARPELFGPADTATKLSYDADDNALLWSGKPMPAPVALKDGSAYVGVRALALWLKRAVDVDSEKRVVTLRRPTA